MIVNYCLYKLVQSIVCQPEFTLEDEHVLREWVGPVYRGVCEEVCERSANAVAYHLESFRYHKNIVQYLWAPVNCKHECRLHSVLRMYTVVHYDADVSQRGFLMYIFFV